MCPYWSFTYAVPPFFIHSTIGTLRLMPDTPVDSLIQPYRLMASCGFNRLPLGLSIDVILIDIFLLLTQLPSNEGSKPTINLLSRIVNGRIIYTMNNLTDNAKKVFIYITKFQLKNGFSPSVPEIMKATGIKSLRGVSIQLEKLQDWGFIHRDKQARRAIKILMPPLPDEMTMKLPLVGEIRAGLPTLASENIEGYRDVLTSDLHGRSDAFLLRVRGDSMSKAHLNSGDIVIVAPQPVPDNGDIVVAFMPDEETATLKRFKKMDDYVMLLPESHNPEYQPIIARSVMIQGKVIGKLADH
ncbi:MAG: LexA repressor [Elusimicrobia bacterium]|nr:LexA repressor [Elusimicrobiota bacterium]